MIDTESRVMQHCVDNPDSAGEPPRPLGAALLRAKLAPEAVDEAVFSADQMRHVQGENAKAEVRRVVPLPPATEAWVESVELREVLGAASRLFRVWAEVEPEVLGVLTHAEPSLHATVINAQHFVDEARRQIDRAAGRLADWTAALQAIVAESLRYGAWEYVSVAGRALMDGPHTESWAYAVQWFRTMWRSSVPPSAPPSAGG